VTIIFSRTAAAWSWLIVGGIMIIIIIIIIIMEFIIHKYS
jgi:hypothetical protein